MPSTVTDRLFGLSTSVAVKAPCKAVALTNITLSGLQTLNGVTVAADDRVLVTAQTTQSENGIYLASTSNWSRAADFDGARDVVQGTQVPVALNGAQTALYEVSSANPITIGSSAITFILRYSANAQYDITDAEIAAGVTPSSYVYPAGIFERYGATGDNITNDYAAISSALLQAGQTGGSPAKALSSKTYYIGAGTLSIPDSGIMDITDAGLRTTDECAIGFGSNAVLIGTRASITTSGAAGAALKKTDTGTPAAFYIYGWPSLTPTSFGTSGSIGLDFTAAYKGIFEVGTIEGYETAILGGSGAVNDLPQTYYNEIRSPRVRVTGGVNGIYLRRSCNGTTIINPQVSGANDATYLMRFDTISGLTVVGGYCESPDDTNAARGVLLNAAVNVSLIGITFEIGTSSGSNYAIGGTGACDNVNFVGCGFAGAWGASNKIMDWTASGGYSFRGGAPSNYIEHLGQTTFPSGETNGTFRGGRMFCANISASASAAAATAHTMANSGDGIGAEISNDSATTTAARAALVVNRKGGAGCVFSAQINGTDTIGYFFGAGSPEGAQAAPVGSEYNDTTNGVKYMKKTGTGNTGWKLVTQAA